MFSTLILGAPLVALYFKGVELGIENYPSAAISSIRSGKYDELAGVSLSRLDIPENEGEWNGLSTEPIYHIPYD